MRECPSCGATMPESADQCPSCQKSVADGSGSKQTLMGIPTEGGGQNDSEPDEDEDGRSEHSTRFGMPAVDGGGEAGDSGEAESEEEVRKATSTQYGMPAVEDGGTFTDNGQPAGDENSDDDAMAARGLSSETSTGPMEDARRETVEDDSADEADAGPSRGDRPDKLKTMTGMPKADETGPEEARESASGDGESASSSQEVEIDSMDELERQVRELEDRADEVDASGSSPGAGVLRRSSDGDRADGQEGDDRETGVGLESSSAASVGPGSYGAGSGSSKIDDADDDRASPPDRDPTDSDGGGALGDSTDMQSDAEIVDEDDHDPTTTAQGAGIPAPSELDRSEEAEESDGERETFGPDVSDLADSLESSDPSVPSPEAAGAGEADGSSEETGGAESETPSLADASSVPTPESQAPSVPDTSRSSQEMGRDVPADSGLGDSQGPTGFEVDESEEELAMSGNVSDAPFRGRLEQNEAVADRAGPEEAAEPESPQADDNQGSAGQSRRPASEATIERTADLPPEATPPPEDDEESREDEEPTVERSRPDLEELASANEAKRQEEPASDSPTIERSGPSSDRRGGSEEAASEQTVERAIESAELSPDRVSGGESDEIENEGAFAEVEETTGEALDEGLFEPVDERPDRAPAGDGTSEQEPTRRDAPEESGSSAEMITGASRVETPTSTSSVSEGPESGGSTGGAPTPAQVTSETGEVSGTGQYAELIQTIFGLLAGITYGLFVAVQLIVAGLASDVLLSALTLSGGLATLVAFVLPFLPIRPNVQSGIYLGFGVLVAALAVAAMMMVTGGPAVGPLIALFGSVFAVGAGLVQQALSAVG